MKGPKGKGCEVPGELLNVVGRCSACGGPVREARLQARPEAQGRADAGQARIRAGVPALAEASPLALTATPETGPQCRMRRMACVSATGSIGLLR